MPDIVTPEVRSRMMSGIRGKNTKPEMLLRRALHRRGFRYRLHDKRLPGKPDMVFPRRRAVLFVHGCYWHHHKGCRFAAVPGTRQEFWLNKFESNRRRDADAVAELKTRGWRVCIVWECALRHDQQRTIAEVANWLVSSTDELICSIVVGRDGLGPKGEASP